MRVLKKVAILAFLLLMLAACNANTEQEAEEVAGDLVPLEVAVQTDPEELKVNEDVKIQAIVTMGDEQVEDASEVLFEIWKAGSDDREKILAEHTGNGIYEITTSFAEAGTYYIVPHTTARNLHTMPTVEVEVID